MPSMEIVREIRGASVSEQIEIIELILHSLRTNIETERKSTRKPFRRFRIRKFCLGEEIHANRDEMYSGRGL
jgi:hypothetical protein